MGVPLRRISEDVPLLHLTGLRLGFQDGRVAARHVPFTHVRRDVLLVALAPLVALVGRWVFCKVSLVFRGTRVLVIFAII